MRSRFFQILCLVAIASLLGGCLEHSVSGKYIAKSAHDVGWLQLVETPDKHLTGQYDTSTLGKDGKIEYSNLSVTGVVDGDNITLSLKPVSLLPVAIAVSGTFDGNKLTLTGGFANGQPGTIVLVRADTSDYQAQVKALNAKSLEVIAAKATAEAREKAAKMERDFIAGLNQLVGRIKRFNSVADAQLIKLPAAEQRYKTITGKMKEYLNREQQLAGNPRASVARGQLSVAISQGSVATEQVHVEIQSVQGDFQANAQPLMKQVAQSEQSCHRAHRPTADNAILLGGEEWNSACLALLDAAPLFQQEFDAIGRVLAHLEDVYKQEGKSQQRLLQEALAAQ